MKYFYMLTTIAAMGFCMAAIQKLLSGVWRRYFPCLVYLVLMLLLTVPGAIIYFNSVKSTPDMDRYFWVTNTLVSGATIWVVLDLTHRATSGSAGRAGIMRVLVSLTLLVIGASAAVEYSGVLNRWMTNLSRDLSFLTALLNLVLWTFLLRVRVKDRLLLLVSAGIGVQAAGDALGHSLRYFRNRPLVEVGDALLSIATVFALYIWYRAFSIARVTAGELRQPVSS